MTLKGIYRSKKDGEVPPPPTPHPTLQSYRLCATFGLFVDGRE